MLTRRSLPVLWQFMIFRITDDKKHIEIEHKGEKGASFEDFTKLLPVEDCRYAVLDVEIATKSGATANKLIFVAWCARHLSTRATGGEAGRGSEGWRVMAWLCPRMRVTPPLAHGAAAHWRCRSDDNAPVRPKMLYASSKDAIKKALTGINDEYQATESASWLICLAGSSGAHGRRPRAAPQLWWLPTKASGRRRASGAPAPDVGGPAHSLGGQHHASAGTLTACWWPRASFGCPGRAPPVPAQPGLQGRR